MSEEEQKMWQEWRCKECNRPMKCIVCGKLGLIKGPDGPLCFQHLPPLDKAPKP